MRTVAALILALGLSGTPGHAESDTYSISLWGIGKDSCAHWLSNSGNEAAGLNWILGAWSGMNAATPAKSGVGSTTDGEGILGEVRKKCTDSPSLPLIEAVMNVYVRFRDSGK